MTLNSLVQALLDKNWDEAEFQSKKGRIFVSRRARIEGFFDGQTDSEVYPLHVAAKLNAPTRILQTLIDENPKAAMTPDSKYRRLPLHLAVMEGASPKMVLALLKACPQAAKAQDRLGRLAIHYACKAPANSEQNTRYLLKAYGKGALKSDMQGYTALHVACRCGASPEIVRMLVRVAPGSVQAKTAKGSTPLMCAKQAGDNPLIIEILERCKSDVSSVDPEEIFDLGSIGGSSVSTFKSSPTMEEASIASRGGSIASDLWSEVTPR